MYILICKNELHLTFICTCIFPKVTSATQKLFLRVGYFYKRLSKVYHLSVDFHYFLFPMVTFLDLPLNSRCFYTLHWLIILQSLQNITTKITNNSTFSNN